MSKLFIVLVLPILAPAAAQDPATVQKEIFEALANGGASVEGSANEGETISLSAVECLKDKKNALFQCTYVEKASANAKRFGGPWAQILFEGLMASGLEFVEIERAASVSANNLECVRAYRRSKRSPLLLLQHDCSAQRPLFAR